MRLQRQDSWSALYMSVTAVDCVQSCFQGSLQKSGHWVNCELQLPKRAVSKILHLYLIQTSTVWDTEARNQKIWSCREVIVRIRNGDIHAGCIFINEMTFRLNGKVNGIMSVVVEHCGGGTHSFCHSRLWTTFTRLNVVCAISKKKFCVLVLSFSFLCGIHHRSYL
jgi:hypothetical protein